MEIATDPHVDAAYDLKTLRFENKTLRSMNENLKEEKKRRINAEALAEKYKQDLEKKTGKKHYKKGIPHKKPRQ
jgi:hypothetical protein